MDNDNHKLWNVGPFYYYCQRIDEIHKLAETYIDATKEPSFEDFWKIHNAELDADTESLARSCYEDIEVIKQKSKKRSRDEEPTPNKRGRH